jgi:putative DNA primase/helicase
MSQPTLAAIAQLCEGAHRDREGWRARCPVHQGTSDTSLHLWEEDGQVRLKCFAGCERTAIYAALRLDRAPQEPRYQALYSYHDPAGNLLFQVVRQSGPKKAFFQRRPHPTEPGQWVNNIKGVTPVLYHLPEVTKAILAKLPIYLVEGEKDVETLRARGLVATCNAMGAGKWEDQYSEALKDASVILLADNDPTGQAHAALLTTRLAGYVQSLRRVTLPGVGEHEDVTDWLTAGHTTEELVALTTQQKPALTAPHMVVKALADVPPEDIHWLWEPYIPYGKITIVEGDPGLGKTFLMLAIAGAITKGYALPDQEGRVGPPTGQPGRVIYITAEDGIADTLRPRADQVDADLTKLFVVQGWTADDIAVKPFSFQQLNLLEDVIRDLQARLVVLDPLQAFLGADVDMFRANEVRPLLSQLGAIAEAQRCAIIAIRHWTKVVGGKAIYRGQGSVDFLAAARCVLAIGESPEDETMRIVAQSKNNLKAFGKSQMFRLSDDGFEWCGLSDLDANTLTSLQPQKRQHQRKNAMGWLKDALKDGPAPASMLMAAAEALGIPEKTLRRAKTQLGILSTKESGQWYWRLPNYGPWDRQDTDDDAIQW